jgi:hypothetical protein
MPTPPNWTNVRVDRSAVEALIDACRRATQAYEEQRTRTVAALLDGSAQWRGGKADMLLADIGNSFDAVRREITAIDAVADRARATLNALEQEQAARVADRARYYRELEAERVAAERAAQEAASAAAAREQEEAAQRAAAANGANEANAANAANGPNPSPPPNDSSNGQTDPAPQMAGAI